MVHLAFPSMEGHEWIEEGLATYVEPLARARANLAPSEDIWKWLLWGLPKGLSGIERRGVDRSSGWDATYWGGALYCFLADVEIRQRTDNKKSLDDALRGIVKAGGDVRASWPIERALKTGDAAVGVPVLEELYAKMSNGPVQVDLPGPLQAARRLGKQGRRDVRRHGAAGRDPQGHHGREDSAAARPAIRGRGRIAAEDVAVEGVADGGLERSPEPVRTALAHVSSLELDARRAVRQLVQRIAAARQANAPGDREILFHDFEAAVALGQRLRVTRLRRWPSR